MASIKRFEDIECWKEAKNLVNQVYLLTNQPAPYAAGCCGCLFPIPVIITAVKPIGAFKPVEYETGDFVLRKQPQGVF